jgi:hypothetical protein
LLALASPLADPWWSAFRVVFSDVGVVGSTKTGICHSWQSLGVPWLLTPVPLPVLPPGSVPCRRQGQGKCQNRYYQGDCQCQRPRTCEMCGAQANGWPVGIPSQLYHPSFENAASEPPTRCRKYSYCFRALRDTSHNFGAQKQWTNSRGRGSPGSSDSSDSSGQWAVVGCNAVQSVAAVAAEGLQMGTHRLQDGPGCAPDRTVR